MEIQCHNCGQKYRIDDSKIPEQGIFTVECKKCLEKIRVDAQYAQQNITSEKGYTPIAQEAAENRHIMETFIPGIKTSLLAGTDELALDKITQTLISMEYETRRVASRDEMLTRFSFHKYDMLILCQAGDKPDASLMSINSALNSLPPENRRNMFVAWLFRGADYHDTMKAFTLSVDIILNVDDVGRLRELIPIVLDAKHKRYSLLNDCAEKLGEYRLF